MEEAIQKVKRAVREWITVLATMVGRQAVFQFLSALVQEYSDAAE
jgi:hypothetical protein